MSTDPDTLVDAASARSEFEASIMVEALKARDIPAFAIANAGMTLQWEVAATNPFRVSVRRKDLDAAREILASAKADSVDIDWSEVDVGKGEDSKSAVVTTQATARPMSDFAIPVLILLALFWMLWRAFATPGE